LRAQQAPFQSCPGCHFSSHLQESTQRQTNYIGFRHIAWHTQLSMSK